jgi:integrase
MPRKPTGHVRRKANGSVEIIVSLGTDAATGKRAKPLSRSLPAGATDEEIDALKATLLADAERRRNRTSKGTVGELLEEWYATFSGEWSPTTRLDVRRRHLDRYLIPALGSKQLTKLSTTDIDRMYAQLRAKGHVDGKSGLATSTVRRVHAVLHSALHQAVRWNRIAENPATNANPGRQVQHEIQPPSAEQIVKLIATGTKKSAALGVLLFLAANTGARRGEICALRWGDVDLDAGVLTIRHALVHGADGLVEKAPKWNRIRTVSLDASTVAVLRGHWRTMAEEGLGLGHRVGPRSYIFTRTDDPSRPWRPDAVTARFRELVDELELTGLRFHDLRHAAITLMLAAGVDIRTVMGRVGHANLATTQGYAHFVTEADRAAADKLAAVFKAAGATG